MRSLFTICLCFGILISAFAQNTQHFSIFFDHDRSDISPAAAQTLDQVVGALSTAADFEVSLNAYTDNTGSDTYNQALAQSRAEMVQAYLGIFTEKITVSSWGEKRQQFNNNTEEGRQQNRRVDLELKVWSINSPEEFEARLRSKPNPVYSVVNNLEQTIETPAGTMVIIPPGSFVFEDGTEPTEKIDITIREALTPADWIINGLATTSNGELLQSGGMMYISASAGGRELQLAEGAEVTVALPALKGVDKDMQLFYGQHSTGNTVRNWQQATDDNRQFRQTLIDSYPYNTSTPELCAQLKSLKVQMPRKPEDLKYNPVPKPNRPVAPHKPRLAPAPEWSAVARLFSNDGSPKGRNLKKAQQEFAQRRMRFEKDSIDYQADMLVYLEKMKKYETDRIAYQKDCQIWKEGVTQRIDAIRRYQEDLYVYHFAGALTSTLKTVGKKKPIKYRDLSQAIETRAGKAARYLTDKANVYATENPDDKVYRLVFGVEAVRKDKDLQQTIKNFDWWNNEHLLTPDSTRIRIKQIMKTCGLKAISDSINTVNYEKTVLTGTGIHQQHAMASYVTEITQLGWINVDKFYKDTNPRVVMSFEVPDAFAMYAYLPQLNSMLMLTKNEATGVFSVSGVPEGQPVRLMTLKTENGQLWVNQQQITAGKTKDPVFDYTAYSMQAFRKELGRLN